MKNIIKITSKNPGRTVAIFAGVHGNEKAGVLAMDKLAGELELDSGTAYLVYANPEAIEKNKRAVNKNLNRCFFRDNKGTTPEDLRAKELMELLDGCDALLDLHSSTTKETTPFIICEPDSFDIAAHMDFSIVSSNWDNIEPGAGDGYMSRQNKPALCLECGSVADTDAKSELAFDSAYVFLSYFGLIGDKPLTRKHEQKYVKVKYLTAKKTNRFWFAKEYGDFEVLAEDAVFAIDGDTKYRAGKNECIIFPDKNAGIGDEAFIIGEFMA